MTLPQSPLFGSVADVAQRLADVGYLASTAVATTVFLADRLGKPLLVEGPAGVGKTELAQGRRRRRRAPGLVRLQCYEGIDEARALYEWNHAKQLLRITGGPGHEAWDETRDDVFCEEFLLPRPLLTAIRRTEPTVLLVDETDKADVEVEGLLLEVLGDFQVTVPELGTDHGDAAPVRAADLERHPRALRGAQAALPVPAPRLPRRRAGAAHRARAGCRSCPRRSSTRWCASSGCCADWSCARRRRSPRRSTGRARCSRSASTPSTTTPCAPTLGVVLKHQSDAGEGRRRAAPQLI